MYDLMSMESVKATGTRYSGRSSGNLLIDLAVLSVVWAIDEVSRNARIKKIQQYKEAEQFRLVAIDMYSGDFIY